jgi:GNAT superfamily N-acetyltransferase
MVRGDMEHVLDNPVWHALAGPHRLHAMGSGSARHYAREFAPFSAIMESTPAAYADLAAGLPPGTEARLFRTHEEALPPGWRQIDCFAMLQMVASSPPPRVSEVGDLLSVTDAGAMATLVGIAKPGPFGSRTAELGQYLGIWDGDRLVAMAGERMRLSGYVELSAVCVHPEARGRGYAAAVTSRLMGMAFERGERPFLHVRPDNTGAVALYRKLGFETRRDLVVTWRQPL